MQEVNAYVQVAASGSILHDGEIAHAPLEDAEAEHLAESAELQAAVTAGGAGDVPVGDAEEWHPEESDELRAAVTAGGADDWPIEDAGVYEPSLAEAEQAAGGADDQGWQSAGRRRRGGARVREALPTPPPSSSNGRRSRRSRAPEDEPQEVDSVVAAIRDSGGTVEGVWHDGRCWRIQADSRSAEFLQDCLAVLVGRTDIVVDGGA